MHDGIVISAKLKWPNTTFSRGRKCLWSSTCNCSELTIVRWLCLKAVSRVIRELPQCLPFDGPANVDSSPSDTILLFHKSSNLQRCPSPSDEVSGSVPVFIADHFSSAEEDERTQREQEFALQELCSGIPHSPNPASMWEGHHRVFPFSCSLSIPPGSAVFLSKAQPRGCQTYLLLAPLHPHYINSD